LDIIEKITSLPAMNKSEMDIAKQADREIADMEQIVCETYHLLHGGIYSRTVVLAKGTLIAGVEIGVPTTLMSSGHLMVYIGDEVLELDGIHVIPASSGRKQVMYAVEETSLTMSLVTDAKTIEEAEESFTDEPEELMSRLEESVNHITITGV